MLKLKLQYFGHLMWRSDSLEKILMLGKTKGRRRRGQQRIRWWDSITNSMDVNLSKLQEIVEDRGAGAATVHGVTKSQTQLSNWKTTTKQGPSSVCTNISFSQEGLLGKRLWRVDRTYYGLVPPPIFDPWGNFPLMCSLGGFLDLKNEKYVVSVSFIWVWFSFLLLPFILILEYLATRRRFQPRAHLSPASQVCRKRNRDEKVREQERERRGRKRSQS